MKTIRFNPFSLLLGIIVFAIVAVLMFRFLRFIWIIGYMLAPIFLVASYFTHRKPLKDFIKNKSEMFRVQPFQALTSSLFSLLMLPVFAPYLFFKSVFFSQIEKFKQENGAQTPFDNLFNTNDVPTATAEGYTEYTEIESKTRQ